MVLLQRRHNACAVFLFRTIIPLKPTATAKVGPASTYDTTQDREQMLSDYCDVPRSREEIQGHAGIAD